MIASTTEKAAQHQEKSFALQCSVALDPLGALVQTSACYFPLKRTQCVVSDLYAVLALECKNEEQLFSTRRFWF